MKNIIIFICLIIIAISIFSCEKEYSGRTPQTVLTVQDSAGKTISVHPVIDGDIVEVGSYKIIVKSSRRHF